MVEQERFQLVEGEEMEIEMKWDHYQEEGEVEDW